MSDIFSGRRVCSPLTRAFLLVVNTPPCSLGLFTQTVGSIFGGWKFGLLTILRFVVGMSRKLAAFVMALWVLSCSIAKQCTPPSSPLLCVSGNLTPTRPHRVLLMMAWLISRLVGFYVLNQVSWSKIRVMFPLIFLLRHHYKGAWETLLNFNSTGFQIPHSPSPLPIVVWQVWGLVWAFELAFRAAL